MGGQQHIIGLKATTHLDESLMGRVWVEQKGGFGLCPPPRGLVGEGSS